MTIQKWLSTFLLDGFLAMLVYRGFQGDGTALFMAQGLVATLTVFIAFVIWFASTDRYSDVKNTKGENSQEGLRKSLTDAFKEHQFMSFYVYDMVTDVLFIVAFALAGGIVGALATALQVPLKRHVRRRIPA